jgi:hypothetical protein
MPRRAAYPGRLAVLPERRLVMSDHYPQPCLFKPARPRWRRYCSN